MEIRSHYVAVGDGTRLALTVHLPSSCGSDRLPTILRATRYWRDFRLMDTQEPFRRSEPVRFTDAGYAFVSLDVRGSGASFGSWLGPWSHREIEDLGEVVAWIASQPWSNGRVGAEGVSYDADCAELLSTTRRPALDAVVLRAPDFDLFGELLYPGGVYGDWFIRAWGTLTQVLDGVRPLETLGEDPDFRDLLPLIVDGPPRVDEDVDGALLAAAVKDHMKNFDILAAGPSVTFRDDPFVVSDPADATTPMVRNHEIDEAGVPAMILSSWWDAGTAVGALRRFLTRKTPQTVVIGPWSHGGGEAADPFADQGAPVVPDLDSQYRMILSFFDLHLKKTTGESDLVGHRVRYCTYGLDGWRESVTWPPPRISERTWHLDADGVLSSVPATADGVDLYHVDFGATTGTRNRWHTQVDGAQVFYGDRTDEDKRLLTYTTAPLLRDLTITGAPIAYLHVRSSRDDAAFFAYLELVQDDDTVRYLTEGQLRGIHRAPSGSSPEAIFGPHHSFCRQDSRPLSLDEITEVAIGLWPISVRIPAGVRMRLAVAGHDAGTFARIPATGNLEISVFRGAATPSRMVLPVESDGMRESLTPGESDD